MVDMAAKGEYSAGTIFLQVVPVFRDTMNEIRRETKNLSDGIGEDLAKAGREGGKRSGEQFGEEFTKKANDIIDKKMGVKKAKVEVEFDDKHLGDFDRRIAKTARDMAKSLGKELDPAIKAIADDLAAIGNVKIGAKFDGNAALRDLRTYTQRLNALVPKTIETTADMNIASAVRKGATLSKMAGAIDGKSINIDVDVRGAGAAAGKIGMLNALLGAFQPRANAAGTASENAANSFRSFNFRILGAVTLLPALIPMLASLGGGLLALIPILGAVGVGIGTMILGFSGIGDAVKEMGAVADEQALASGKAAKGAKQVAGAQRGVADAQRGVANAQRGVADAVRAVEDAERSLQDARRNAARANADAARAVADARRNAAEAIEDAYKAQQDAAEAYRDSVKDVRDAEEDLRQARLDAAADAADLATRQRKNAVDERQALVDLFDAQVRYNAIMADGSSTNVDKERASIDLEQAQIALNDTRTEQVALADEAADYAKNGVDGSDKVKDAQDAVTAALEAQKDAQEDAKEAAEDYRDVQVDSARQIQDALRDQARTAADGQRAIADAQRGLADAQRGVADAERGVAEAQRGVADAQRGVADAVTAMADESTAAMDRLDTAMSKLSPAGQKFARFLFGLREGFRETRDAVQEAMLPGIQAGLQLIIDEYGPQFRAFVVDFATRIGDLGEDMGRGLAGPEWKAFFGAYEKRLPRMFEDSSRTLGNFSTALAGIFTVVAPYAERLSEALLDMSERASRFFNSAEGKTQVREFLEYAFEVGPKVVAFFRDLAKFGVDVGKALEPFGTAVMDGLAAFFNWVDGLDPKIVSLMATGLLGLAIAFQLAVGAFALIAAGGAVFGSVAGALIFSLGVLATFVFALYQNFELVRDILDPIGSGLRAIGGFLLDHAGIIATVVGAVVGLIAAVKVIQTLMLVWRIITLNMSFAMLILNSALFANPLGLVVLAIIAVIAILVAAYFKFDSFRVLVDKVWLGIKIGFGLMVDGMRWAWKNVLLPVFKAMWEAIKYLWSDVVKPLFKAIWGAVQSAFTTIRWVWKNILWPVLDLIIKTIEHLWIKVAKPIFGWISGKFDTMTTAMKVVWDTTLKPLLQGLGDFMNDTVKPRFKTAIDFITGLWDGLKAVFASPVRFLIEEVINKGIISAFNFVANKVGSTPMGTVPVPGWATAPSKPAKEAGSDASHSGRVAYADGGVLPGYTPGRDPHKFYSRTGGNLELSGGEGIIRPEATAVLGQGWVHGINAAARRGGAGAVKRMLGGGQAFAKGGIFWPVPGGYVEKTAYNLGHDGMDINHARDAGPDGEGGVVPFYSATSGRVSYAGYARGYGNAVYVASPYGELVYGHAYPGSIRVGAGQDVSPGDMLAMIGNTGNSFGAHLHFGFPGGSHQAAAALLAGAYHGKGRPAGPAHKVPGWAEKLVTKPMEWANSYVTKPIAKMKETFGSNDYVNMLARVPLDLSKSLGKMAAKNIKKSAFNRAGELAANVATLGGWGMIKRAASATKDALDGGGEGGGQGGQGDYSLAYRNGGILPYNGAMMYDNGGYLPPGLTTVMNLTGKPEPVFTANQFEGLNLGEGGESFTYAPTFNKSDLTAADVIDDLDFHRRKAARQGKYERSMS